MLAEFAKDPRYAALEWLKLPVESLHNGYFAADKSKKDQHISVWKDIKQENKVAPIHFQFARKRGGESEFIERKLPRPSLPTPVVRTEQPRTPAAMQAKLPLFDAPADKPKEAFVWDESKGID